MRGRTVVFFDIQGHTGCGGAAACYEAACGRLPVDANSPLAQFVTPMVKLAVELGLGDKNGPAKADAIKLLTEENVRRQVHNIVNSETMQKVWKQGKKGTWFSQVRGLVSTLTRLHQNSDCSWMGI